MATTKPTKPTNLMPRHFADEGIKNNFSSAKIVSGFSSNFNDILQGDNLNYMLDSIGKELQYLSSVVDFIVDMPINKTFKVNANNNLEYVNLVEDASDKANVGLDNLNASGNNKVLPSQTGNSGKFLTTNGTSPSWTSVDIANRSLSNLTGAGEARLTEGKRNIGEIVTSTIPLVDAGLHPLDGAKLEYGIYKDFIDYIASIYSASANYFCTEAEWQQSYTDYGVCGKFVYDSTNNTVRLPKVTGFVEGASGVSSLGDLTEAGLPNITGATRATAHPPVSGAIYGISGGAYGDTYHAEWNYIGFDASLSNTIYGNSSTVQPQSVKVLYYIVIATSTKTDIQVDIDEIATDLNGKADVDLTNVTNTSGLRRLIEVSPTSILPSWYKVFAEYDPTTGNFIGNWCEQGGFAGNITTNSWIFVTLLKPYINTNYTVIGSGVDPSISTSYPDQFFSYRSPLQTTGFYGGVRILSGGTTYADRGFTWQASGYIS